MIGTILFAVLGVVAVICAVAGLIKGVTKTSFWGCTVLLTLLIERTIGASVSKDGKGFATAVLIATFASLLIFTVLFSLFRKLVNGRMKARRTLSEYENYDLLEENETRILSAVDENDTYAYKQLRKERKKIKTTSGGWGVVNRIVGAVAGLLNGFVGAFIFVSIVALVADLAQISFLYDAFESFLTSATWANAFGAIALDMIIIGVLGLVAASGFKSGVSSIISALIIFGLVVLFGYASFGLASSEAASGMVQGMENGMLAGVPEIFPGLKRLIAVGITTAIFFLFSLIAVVVVAILLPKLAAKFNDNKVLSIIDGVFGVILFTAVIFGLFLAVGGIAYTLNDFAVMVKVNGYMGKSFLADCAYSRNPLAQVFEKLPVRNWFGGTAQ